MRGNIVPADLRLDATADRIYLRAEGGPWTGGPDVTVLFEYDLKTRKMLEKRQIEESARLPDLCPATLSSGERWRRGGSQSSAFWLDIEKQVRF
jgi:hypothetical protein